MSIPPATRVVVLLAGAAFAVACSGQVGQGGIDGDDDSAAAASRSGSGGDRAAAGSGGQSSNGGALAASVSGGAGVAGAGGKPSGGTAGANANAGGAGQAGAAPVAGQAGAAPVGGQAGATPSAGKSGGAAGAAVAGAGGVTSMAGAGGAPAIDGPAAGNPKGTCAVPTEAQAEDVSHPTTVVGNGTPESCSSDAFVDAVAKGGVITFACGTNAKTIVLTRTAKIFNDKGPKIVIDGGGKVTLSGGGKLRILYQNTCDSAQRFTTDHCDNQDSPQLTVQNLTFVDGNSTGQLEEGGGGGAIFVRGGRLKIVNARFFRNACDPTGQDLGGAAVRVLSQYQGSPVYVVNSTFGGAAGYGNKCSNGGGLSSIGVSFTVINSLFAYNEAVGSGANPARAGTKGGGSGGAIYNDGNKFTLTLCGTNVTSNSANEGGGAIFFVSNDRSGTLVIKDSTLMSNPNKGFETAGYPGIFVLGNGTPQVSGSTIK